VPALGTTGALSVRKRESEASENAGLRPSGDVNVAVQVAVQVNGLRPGDVDRLRRKR
jgi:hypothetical protein